LGRRFWTRPQSPSHVYPGGLEQRKYWIEVDSNGFLAPSRVHERADLEIVFLGGSTTEELFVSPEARFPYLVGRMLEDSLGRTVNAYNGGRSGNIVLHNVLAFLGKVAPMRPKYVVLMENINDLAVLGHYGSYWHPDSPRSLMEAPPVNRGSGGPLRRLKDATSTLLPNTYATLAGAWDGLRGPMTPPDEFAGSPVRVFFDQDHAEAEFRRSLETFVATARIWDVTPVLMSQASRFSERPEADVMKMWDEIGAARGMGYEAFQRRYARFNEIIREVARRQQVPLVDLDRILKLDRNTMYDAVHYTDAGSQLAATVIARELLSLERRQGPAIGGAGPERATRSQRSSERLGSPTGSGVR
jgi:lysophospholipase L1-like esterase